MPPYRSCRRSSTCSLAQEAPAAGDRPAATTEEEALSALQARVPAELADKAKSHGRQPPIRGRAAATLRCLSPTSHGFTALGKGSTPRSFASSRTISSTRSHRSCTRHEGFVEKFVGDAVVALFGAPLRPRRRSGAGAARGTRDARADGRRQRAVGATGWARCWSCTSGSTAGR